MATVDPNLRPDYPANGDLLALYQENRGNAIVGLVLGLTLSFIALLLAILDRIKERRANEVALRVVGASRMQLLRWRGLQAGVSVSLIAASGWLVAQMTATSYLSVSGLHRGLFTGGLAYGALTALLCLGVVITVALAQPPVSLRPEDLHRE
jgi:hypothetical protein